jgi:hypothetical protein
LIHHFMPCSNLEEESRRKEPLNFEFLPSYALLIELSDL